MNTNDRVLFMGTPEFAVESLNALHQAGIPICAVVTAPDRPAGRGRKLTASAVKVRALELGLPILQPEKLKAPEFLAELDEYNASLYVVVAFRMLPEVVWSKPRLGTINLHASLLPDYRGAAPINWAVINGEQLTGATTFRIQQEIDTGDILLKTETPIGPNETAGTVHDRLMVDGAELIVRTVEGLFAGTLKSTPQESGTREHPIAPKLNPSNTRVHWDRPARSVHDLIRGLSPYPGAWCEWVEGGAPPIHCKLLKALRVENGVAKAPGTVVIEEGRLLVACADGWIEILELQLQGKRRMSVADLLRGLRINGVVDLR